MFHCTDGQFACAQMQQAIAEKTAKAFEDVVVGMFYLRDPRGGEGRVAIFYSLLSQLHEINPDLAITVLPLIPEYGSWDDMFTIAAKFPVFKNEVLRLAEQQLSKDEANLANGQPISMFAKWVPDEKKSLKLIAKEFAYYLVRSFSPRPEHSMIMASYRRRISKLNKMINPVEIYECAGRWDEIDPATVAEGALRVKRAAYLNENIHTGEQRSTDEKRKHCAENFREFFEARPPGSYTKLEANSTRYDPVRAIVNEWVQGGWRF